MVCRGLMLALHRAGHLALPPVRRVTRNPLAQRARPRPVEVDRTPVRTTLRALGPLRTRQVRRTADEALCNSLLAEYHYLGHAQPVGEHLTHLVSAGGRPRHMEVRVQVYRVWCRTCGGAPSRRRGGTLGVPDAWRSTSSS